MDALEHLRDEVKGEEFDYLLLMNTLKDYAKPRDKVTRYLKEGSIIRIKKGLYVFGKRWRRELISLEVLANLIYGPSYVSLEYALSFYGLIPEKVECVTSVTTQKNKHFQTPIGLFSYSHLNLAKYHVGILQYELDTNRHFLIASKEKALADVLVQQKPFRKKEELYEHLIENLRIEESLIWTLDLTQLKEIAEAYRHPTIDKLAQLIQEKL